jgi:hypothetical protein
MSVGDHAATDCCKKSSREGCAGGVVGSLHEEACDSSQMNHNKSNRGGGWRKRTGQRLRHATQPKSQHGSQGRFLVIGAEIASHKEARVLLASSRIDGYWPSPTVLRLGFMAIRPSLQSWSFASLCKTPSCTTPGH